MSCFFSFLAYVEVLTNFRGLEIQFDIKNNFGAFLAKISYLRPILLAKLLYEPIFIIYAMGIVA